MCVANSARSQLAEALAKVVLGPQYEIESAGSSPSTVNPLGIEVLQEMDIDITNNIAKELNDLSQQFLKDLDYVITLCAEEVCPTVLSKAEKLHWPLPDPVGKGEENLDQERWRFRQTRDEIKRKLILFKNEFKK